MRPHPSPRFTPNGEGLISYIDFNRREGIAFWADTIGLSTVVEKLKALRAAHGDAFAPAQLLVDMAATGRRFAQG